MGDCGGSGSGGRRTTSRILAAGALSSGDIHHLTEERTHSIRLIGRILHRLVEFLDIPTLQIRDLILPIFGKMCLRAIPSLDLMVFGRR